MHVKVTKVSNKWKPVEVGGETGDNLLIVTQTLDDGETYHLNINSKQGNRDYLLGICKTGNVIDGNPKQLWTGEKFVKFIDKYGAITLIKEAANGEVPEQLPGQTSML